MNKETNYATYWTCSFSHCQLAYRSQCVSTRWLPRSVSRRVVGDGPETDGDTASICQWWTIQQSMLKDSTNLFTPTSKVIGWSTGELFLSWKILSCASSSIPLYWVDFKRIFFFFQFYKQKHIAPSRQRLSCLSSAKMILLLIHTTVEERSCRCWNLR